MPFIPFNPEESSNGAPDLAAQETVKYEAKLVENEESQGEINKEKTGFIPFIPGMKEGAQPGVPKKQTREEDKGLLAAYKEGIQKSATGLLESELQGMSTGERAEIENQDKSFWEDVMYEAGTLTGDAPWMMLGGAIGSSIGAFGGPIGALVGGSAGTMALPAAMKETFRQYKQFQEKGGDLTFGEFIERSGEVGTRALNEGLFGAVLGMTKQGMNILRKVPFIKSLFDTKYVGPIAREATTIGAEAGVATTVPAAAEGRLPTKEDLAKATVLFTGGRLSHLPFQLPEVIANAKEPKFKYALAERIEKLDLAYPPLNEFKIGENPVYKNSVELDRNLTAFDTSYIQNIASRIESLSETEFSSAHEAGTKMKEVLKPLEPEKPIEATLPINEPQTTPAPVKTLPLVQNPLIQVADTIAPQKARSLAELGRRVTFQYAEAREAEAEPLRQRYRALGDEVHGIQINDEHLANNIESFVDEFGPSASPGRGDRAIARANDLIGLLIQYDNKGERIGAKDASLKTLIATNRSIKQIPNWEVPPEMSQKLGELTAMVDEAIAGQIRNYNEVMADEYVNLNRDYHMFKNRFDNSDMKIFYDRTENSEAVGRKFTKLDEFSQLNQALSGSPAGNEVLNLLRREAWEKGVGDKALNSRTEAEFQRAVSGLGEREFNDLMEFLTPEQRQIAITAAQHTNQIRQSAENSKQNFDEWKRQERQNKKNKSLQQEVQTKQDLLVSLLQEDPAKLVGNMKTIEGIKRMKEATKKVNGGNELYDSLARYETENMFNFMREGYSRTGRAPYKEMKVQLENKEFRAKIKEMNGEKFLKDMDQLVEVANELSENFKEKRVEYKDDPTTLNAILQVYSIYGLAHGNLVTPLLAFTAKKNILKLGEKALNIWNTKRNLDPEFIRKTLKAGREINYGSQESIRKAASTLSPPYKY